MGRRARKFDASFEAFFEQTHARLVSGLTLITADREVAAEAVAEAMARAWEQMRRGREIENLESWVRTVALNCARRTYRRQASERRASERIANDTHAAAQRSDASELDHVQVAPAGLSERERSVAVMRYIFGLAIPEIASELDLSTGTVENYLHRAKAKLKRGLEADETTIRTVEPSRG
jgi:RNA polymerase sigma-70 factor (ECF subfamily)